MLLDAASQAWQVPLAELTTRDGAVLHEASGQQSPYGDLLEAISRFAIQPPETVALKDPGEFKILGKPPSATKGRARSTAALNSASTSSYPGCFTVRSPGRRSMVGQSLILMPARPC